MIERLAHLDEEYRGILDRLASPEVLSDMILVLRDGRKPGKENGRPLEPRDDGFWNINDGYPNARPKK